MACLRPLGNCKWLFINYFKLESSLFLGGFFLLVHRYHSIAQYHC